MEIVNISYKGVGDSYQSYNPKDAKLISANYINNLFGAKEDYVELFIYDLNEQLLDVDYNYIDYTPIDVNSVNKLYPSIGIDPEADVRRRGYNRGSVTVQYNFLKSLFGSNVNSQYWIKEISPSRQELKLSSQTLSNLDIQAGFSSFQTYVSKKNYYTDFYLNFGNNEYIACVNAALSIEDDNTYLLLRLYEPLSFNYDIKDSLWIVDKMAESVSYQVDIEVSAEKSIDFETLRGPNYYVNVNQKLGQTTPYYNYNGLFSTSVSSSLQKIKSWYDDKAVEINIDYSDFSNFVHFSSAVERLKNFAYKLQLIESYNSEIIAQQNIFGFGGVSEIKGSAIDLLKSNISNIIEKFDTYEYYLYFSSESFAWPKSNSTQPYSLYSVTSSQALNWLGSENTITNGVTASLLYSASYYDSMNSDRLTNAVPGYIADDSNNAHYMTFLNMVGQHFDNIWIYYKDVSNRYDATNNPNTGISKDIVAEALRGFGVQLYTNSNISDNVYYTLFGINEDGSLLPPTGSEIINYSGDNLGVVTSSLATLPADTIQKEIYKRLYHNLPYLLKTKGTRRGVKALLSCFGIPESLLTINEFGGYFNTQKSGIDSINNDKINLFTGSIYELSSSVLRPDSTIQYYDNNVRKNSAQIEVGFSPADQINAHITSSLGYFFIDQYIGNPGDMYSSSYQKLDSFKNTYFSNYYYDRYNIWSYIRLIKFFNNSLFKMIKDFIPARASLSTGVIIKSHLLERNKYARREPNSDISSSIEEGVINMISIEGSDPALISGSTIVKGLITSSIGYIPYTSSTGVEKYNGEFQNSEIVATSLNSFQKQFEISNISNFTYTDPNQDFIVTTSLDYLLNNVTQSVRSNRFIDLDYSYNQIAPVNYGLITQSIKNPSIPGPYAYMQDYGYYTNAFTVPRYYGSKVQSSIYTYYVNGESGSYGNTAAVDKQKYQYAYLVDIYTASFNLPKRSNAQIKYIIDRDSNVLDLTKTNTNIFYTQNIFKSGETVNISLFDYDPRNPDVQFLTNNSNLIMYEGGWRYTPVLYNITGSECLVYKFDPPLEITNTVFTPSYTKFQDSSFYSIADTTFVTKVYSNPMGAPGNWLGVEYTASIVSGPSPTKNDTYLTITFPRASGNPAVIQIRIPANSTIPAVFYGRINNPGDGTPSSYYSAPSARITAVQEQVTIPATTTTTITYETGSRDCNNKLFVKDPFTIYLSKIQSTGSLYGKAIQTDISYPGMETIVFPFDLQNGDMVKFRASRDSQTEYWPESEEYRIVSAITIKDADGDDRVAVTLDRPLNLKLTDTGNIGGYIERYIFNKHIPDETNIILRYDPKSNITQDGILFPYYIEQTAKDNSGNIIKSLKDQNLI